MTRHRIVRTAAAAFLLTGMGCVRQTRVTAAQAPAPPAQTVWDKQIRNAHNDGDYELKVLRERVEGDAASVPARLELARAYAARGYGDVALEICRLAVARFPESNEARLGLMRALHDVNRRAEAIEVAQAYVAGHPQAGAEYHSWLGILTDEDGKWAEGEPHHRQAVAAMPGSDALHNNLGYNLLMQRKNEEAAAEFREALRINPNAEVARNNLGLALAGRSATEAVAAWKAGSDEASAHNNLAALWIEKKEYAQARKELEIALSYNRSHPAALHNLELVSRLDGKPATMGARPVETTRWERLKTGFIRLWVGPLDEPHTETTKPQSSSTPGDKQ